MAFNHEKKTWKSDLFCTFQNLYMYNLHAPGTKRWQDSKLIFFMTFFSYLKRLTLVKYENIRRYFCNYGSTGWPKCYVFWTWGCGNQHGAMILFFWLGCCEIMGKVGEKITWVAASRNVIFVLITSFLGLKLHLALKKNARAVHFYRYRDSL